MKSIVVYASHSGNTRLIAEAIAGELELWGEVRLLAADDLSADQLTGIDLLVVGSPTEGWRLIAPAAQLFDRLGPDALHGMAAAAFDTRLHGPRWLTGSAAHGIARRLGAAGARSVVPPESFFVTREPTLESGDLKRARRWAVAVLAAAEPCVPAPGGAR